ncbi:MAG TPA: tRNA (N(6)-L-threonylcarbamoyladenosine(37)-C(2))-methylthiotransferase MtaB [Dehalococcoidia bacterium]|nr:tRNA (N(6)-L-threonylcarbamoyladenosine(37)-C(2))-methylthiotransferase MtaB [Dehalococcoidia bacterium]
MTRLLQIPLTPLPSVRARGRVAIETLGCKLNQAESDALARSFQAAGYELTDPRQPADIFILNSCTVTHEADRKARQTLRRARRLSPTALTVLTGCYPSVAPDEAAQRSGADLILPNRDKAGLVEVVAAHQARIEPTLPEAIEQDLPGNPGPERRTRAFVKIQDGCNDFCAFCIVPTARGRSVSRPPDEIIAEVADRVAEGLQEVVLTGVQIGWYGRGGGLRRRAGWDLAALIRGILRDTAVARVRLTSIHPRDVSPALIEVLTDRRVCPHLHMSLQSGSERILSLMRRRYTASGYLAKVEQVRARVPDLAFTTDIIVGFPGETDEDFEETCRVSRLAGFAQIHAFRYSARAGTTAAGLPNLVPEPVKSSRAERLSALAGDLGREFVGRSLGQTRPVLFESRTPGGSWTGLTDTYLRVEVESGRDLRGHLRPVRLEELAGDRLIGRLAGA